MKGKKFLKNHEPLTYESIPTTQDSESFSSSHYRKFVIFHEEPAHSRQQKGEMQTFQIFVLRWLSDD